VNSHKKPLRALAPKAKKSRAIEVVAGDLEMVIVCDTCGGCRAQKRDSMVALSIPRGYESQFETFTGVVLNDESIRELLSVLREEDSVFNAHELTSRVAAKVDSIELSDVEDTMQILVSLYLLRARYESPIHEFAEDICRAMDESSVEALRLPSEERNRFKDHLIELLDLESISIGTKAIDLQYENEHTFSSARIVTDVRPIFGANLEDAPAGAVIVHTLKITYREGNRHRDFFIALDAEDLSLLGGLLERADSKAKNLKSFLEGTKVTYIDTGEER
jgi:hypothetical protein